MSAPHQWLRELRVRLGLRQDEVETRTAALGEDARVTQSYLSRLERGTKPIVALTPARLDALRRVYHVQPDEWAARTGLRLVAAAAADEIEGTLDHIRVPVRALANAGIPLDDEGGAGTATLDTELVPRTDYRGGMVVLEVHGESMTLDGEGIRHGDRVYVDRSDLELREGKIYVLNVHGAGTVVKRVRRYDGEFWLTSDNPDYPPLRPDAVTVVGRVYYHQPRGRRL
ncbi:LexA family transcriptional regulator [Deinococcus pimensis]|uniref:LexA family transcriptional regulator n=1 Tax=Deinococcus pimensis TaxID=309888 RepID=UPI00048827FF|nr:S24 family peptidase [Deinococcus pimensis]